MKTRSLSVCATLATAALPITAIASGGWFYTPPTPLSEYHERIPAKTAQALINEFMPRPANAAADTDIAAGVVKIIDGTEHRPISRVDVIKSIDALLNRNRQGDYRKRYANALYDLRDLISNAAVTDEEIASYARWRELQISSDNGYFATAPSRSWDMTDAQYEAAREQFKLKTAADRTTLTDELAKASAALRPHWLVQLGAFAFKQHDFDEALKAFQEVTDKYSGTPRAEVAQLMIARCRLELWRTEHNEPLAGRDRTIENKLEQEAEAALEAYLANWPKGRFALDIPGWQAGMARLRGEWEHAIQLIARQLDDPAHPEIARRALQEFERMLGDIAKSNVADSVDEYTVVFPWKDIAAHPVLAMRVLGFLLDSDATVDARSRQGQMSEIFTDSYVTGTWQQPMLRIRSAGRLWLHQLADAVASNRRLSGDAALQSRQMLMLAWASSESGLQTQAVRLLDRIAKPDDEALFARAVILSRAKRYQDAAKACATLLRDFPKSALAGETRFRLALALKDSGDWAGALLAIHDVREAVNKADSAEGSDAPLKTGETPVSLRLDSEIDDWKETILHFAPVGQLRSLVTDPRTPPSLWSQLVPVLRARLLAVDDFDGALAVARTTREGAEPGWGLNNKFWGSFDEPVTELPETEWLAAVENLSRLQHLADDATDPAAKAGALMEQAALWDQHRGRLTAPLIDEYPRVAAGQPGCVKLSNAVFIGIPEKEAGETLDRRDELHHAVMLWLSAADVAPRTATAAKALSLANEALRRIAEFHDTNFQRAFETDAATLSRQIFDRLKRDHPTTDEAKRAAWWTFPALGEVSRLPNNGHRDEHEDAIAAALSPQVLLAEFTPQYRRTPEETKAAEDGARAIQQANEQLRAIADKGPQPADVSTLQRIRSDVGKQPLASSMAERTALLNDLDDAILVLNTPGIADADRVAYLKARLDHGAVPEELADAQSPIASFFAFLRMIRASFDQPQCDAERALLEKNGKPDEDERAQPLALRMEDFMKRFPASPKREAAMTRHVVNTVRTSLVRCHIVNLKWPESSWLGRYVHPAIQYGDDLDEAKVTALLDQYEKEFPNGKYLSEVRMARALVCLETKRWEEALRILSAVLDDPTKADLHHHASLRMAYVFMQLLEPENRPAVRAAIQKVPASRRYLDRFMHSDTCGARLMLMSEWLATPPVN